MKKPNLSPISWVAAIPLCDRSCYCALYASRTIHSPKIETVGVPVSVVPFPFIRLGVGHAVDAVFCRLAMNNAVMAKVRTTSFNLFQRRHDGP